MREKKSRKRKERKKIDRRKRVNSTIQQFTIHKGSQSRLVLRPPPPPLVLCSHPSGPGQKLIFNTTHNLLHHQSNPSFSLSLSFSLHHPHTLEQQYNSFDISICLSNHRSLFLDCRATHIALSSSRIRRILHLHLLPPAHLRKREITTARRSSLPREFTKQHPV